LNTSRIEELKGLLLTVLHPSFISVLTNSYYGGEISVAPNQRTEFTSTEERVIEIISKVAASISGNCTTKEHIITKSLPSTNDVNCGFTSLPCSLRLIGIRSRHEVSSASFSPVDIISITRSSVDVNSVL
jgi:hypothetical protein